MCLLTSSAPRHSSANPEYLHTVSNLKILSLIRFRKTGSAINDPFTEQIIRQSIVCLCKRTVSLAQPALAETGIFLSLVSDHRLRHGLVQGISFAINVILITPFPSPFIVVLLALLLFCVFVFNNELFNNNQAVK